MSFEKYTLENFCRLIEEEFEELPEGTVKPYSDFADFLVLSSVNALILMAKIFNVYGVRIGIDDLKENSNIKELYRFVISKTTLC
jgi:acyl carrier protein